MEYQIDCTASQYHGMTGEIVARDGGYVYFAVNGTTRPTGGRVTVALKMYNLVPVRG